MDEQRADRLRRWGLVAVLVFDVVLLTLAFAWYWRDEPAGRGVHGTVSIEECLPSTGTHANCYGEFTSDDGSVRIADVEIDADKRARVAEGWVDSATDRVVRPVVPDPPHAALDRVEFVVGFLATVAVNVALIIGLLRRRATSRPGRGDPVTSAG